MKHIKEECIAKYAKNLKIGLRKAYTSFQEGRKRTPVSSNKPQVEGRSMQSRLQNLACYEQKNDINFAIETIINALGVR